MNMAQHAMTHAEEDASMPRVSCTLSTATWGVLENYAEEWSLSLSSLARLAIRDLLNNPERVPALLAETYGPIEDERTPAQRLNGERLMRQMKIFDLARVADDLQGETSP